MRGEVLADLGEGNRAISDLNHAAPDVPSSQAARGLALAETGDHTAAEINGALANARRSGLVLLYAARASDLAGDNVSAKERAREAIDATDPPLSPPHKIAARQIGVRALAAQCRVCPVRSVCGGGLYSHRYDKDAGFLNPSVYCPDLLALIRHIRGRVLEDLNASRARDVA